MKITVASGKGGTGKTTVATSLALSLTAEGRNGMDHGPPLFLDCDVEAPNAHIFLEPVLEWEQEVNVPVPQVDEDRCNHCGRCAEVCQWHAIAVVGKRTLVFPQMCHGCGSCAMLCPEGAIREVPNPIGVLEAGPARGGITFARGVLHIGQPLAVPIIRQVKRRFPARPGQTLIIDAPPGTTCPVVESMRGADLALLVTEPTPFGLHDLRMAVQAARELGLPVGVVVNRDGVGDSGVDDYCRQARLPILMRIPLNQRIAEGIARGTPLVYIWPAYAGWFRNMYERIEHSVERNRNGGDARETLVAAFDERTIRAEAR